jgi:hypothetical protein
MTWNAFMNDLKQEREKSSDTLWDKARSQVVVPALEEAAAAYTAADLGMIAVRDVLGEASLSIGFAGGPSLSFGLKKGDVVEARPSLGLYVTSRRARPTSIAVDKLTREWVVGIVQDFLRNAEQHR